MSTTVTLNGSTYSIPAVGERLWGNNVSNYLIATAGATLQKSGGVFTLTADVNFGANFGIISKYFKSTSSNIATTGIVRFANNEGIGFRNSANNADIILKVNASNRLEVDGVAVPTISSTDALTNKTLVAASNTITTAASGNLAATELNAALAELQTDIDTRATGSALSTHVADVANPHAVTKTQVGLGNVDNTSDVTKNAATVTLTNKTLTAPVIDDGMVLNHESSVTTPASGKVALYPKSDNRLYLKDNNGVETPVGSGSGQGEKNYITNPSGQSAVTGWNNVGDLDIVRTTTVAELPREYSTATGLKITADSNTQSTADYVYFDFNLDDVDLSKKLKIQWSQKPTGSYTAGQLAVVITTQADRTTAVATPVTTAIPASNGDFVTTFDSSTTAALSLVIRATGDMTTDAGVVISDVIVGPGEVNQGAAISEWQDYSSPTTSGFGTISSSYVKYMRIGSSLRMLGRFTTGTVTATPAQITLPLGLTVGDTGAGAPRQIVGTFWHNSSTASNPKRGVLGAVANDTYVSFTLDDYTSAVSPFSTLNGNQAVGSTTVLGFDFTIPIAQWAGSGTVNLGPGAQVEYAYNTDVSSTASVTASGYANGAAGVAFSSSWSTNANDWTRTVQWQYPIQDDDVLELQIYNGAIWTAYSDYLGSYQRQSTKEYGPRLNYRSSTQTDVIFCLGGFRATDASYGANGAVWSGLSALKWRVRKSKASAPVGFGMATHTESGLSYKNRFQRKVLTGNVTSDTTITEWAFSNLTIGKVYRLDISARMVHISAVDNQKTGQVSITHTGTTIYGPVWNVNPMQTGDQYIQATSTFVATATTLTMGWTAVNLQLWAPSYASLTELNDTENVSAF